VELQRSAADYERQNIALFGVSYDSVEVLAGFTERYGIDFPLLSDEGSRVIRELGLLNERLAEHQAFYSREMRPHQFGVPYPGAFLLDEQGIITARRFYSSYRVRETGAGLLESGFGL
jgi:peroxiredoxin